MYGVVQAFRTGLEHGVEILVGAELQIAGHSGTLIVLPTNRASYGRLTRLLSLGRLRVGKGSFHINFDDVAAHADGLEAIHVGAPGALALAREKDVFGDRLALAIERTHTPFDRGRIENAQSAAARFAVPLVAVGSVLMHSPERKPLQDILSCVRMGVRLERGGRRLLPNAHRVLRAPQATAQMFSDLPEAVSYSVEIADRCAFRLDELQQSFTL